MQSYLLDFRNILTYHKHAKFYASLKEKPEGVKTKIRLLRGNKKKVR